MQAKRHVKRAAKERQRHDLQMESKVMEEILTMGLDISPEALAAQRAKYVDAQAAAAGGEQPGKKRGANMKKGSTARHGSPLSEASSEGSSTSKERRGVEECMGDAHIHHGIRSVFAKESKEVIEARRQLNYQPLRDRKPMPATGIPFGSWFRMPRRGEDDNAPGVAETSLKPLDAAAAGRSASPSPAIVVDGCASACFPFSVDLPSRGWRSAVDREGLQILSNALACDEAKANVESMGAPTPAALPSIIDDAERARFEAYLRCLETYPLPEHLQGLEMSSYERNLDVWRQLWRAVEVSDVNVLVADARYPIVHMPLGLLTYITKQECKPCIMVLNKTDLVPASVVDQWRRFIPAYLGAQGLTVLCSEEAVAFMLQHPTTELKLAKKAAPIVVTTFTADPQQETAVGAELVDGGANRKGGTRRRQAKMYERLRTGKLQVTDDARTEDNAYTSSDNFKNMVRATRDLQHDQRQHTELQIVSTMITELLALCRSLAPEGKGQPITRTPAPASAMPSKLLVTPMHKRKMNKKRGATDSTDNDDGDSADCADVWETRAEDHAQFVRIAFVGYPNVGKSSLLNCIRGTKVVSVSATPGHTKHLQTIPIPQEGVTLVDSPGLVVPCFGLPKPLQAVLGTHQIAQTRDPQSRIAFLAAHLPIEKLYGLRRPEGADESEPWSAYDLCEAYATKRGYYVKHGKGALDVHRAAIAMLQEAYQGRLSIFFAPPELNYLQSKHFVGSVKPHLLLPVFREN